MSSATISLSFYKHKINKMYPEQYLEYVEGQKTLNLTTYNFEKKKIDTFEIKISDITDIKKQKVEFFEVYILIRGIESIKNRKYKYKWAQKEQKRQVKKSQERMEKDNIGSIIIKLKDKKFELYDICNLDQEYEQLQKIVESVQKTKKSKS